MKKVLLIEDDQDSIALAQAVLDGMVSVIATKTIEQAGILLQIPSWRLVIADHRVLDGCTPPFIKRLRDAGYRTPILGMSASHDSNVRIEMLDAGCDEFLAKPYDTPDLRDLVTKLLQLSI